MFPDDLIGFLRRRLTIARLAELGTHAPLQLVLPYIESGEGRVETRHFTITACASCSPDWTTAQHRREWSGYADRLVIEIPRWVERWPCRHLFSLAAACVDGEIWRNALEARTQVVDG